MNTLRFVVLNGLAATALLVGAGAAAKDPYAARTMEVEYGDLNLTTSQGAKALYSRLRGAARNVCTPFEGRELRRREQWQACYNQALTKAVEQVDRETVSAMHARAMQGRSAS